MTCSLNCFVSATPDFALEAFENRGRGPRAHARPAAELLRNASLALVPSRARASLFKPRRYGEPRSARNWVSADGRPQGWPSARGLDGRPPPKPWLSVGASVGVAVRRLGAAVRRFWSWGWPSAVFGPGGGRPSFSAFGAAVRPSAVFGAVRCCRLGRRLSSFRGSHAFQPPSPRACSLRQEYDCWQISAERTLFQRAERTIERSWPLARRRAFRPQRRREKTGRVRC